MSIPIRMDLTAPRPWWPLADTEQMREALRFWLANNWDTSITVGEWWERLAAAGLAVPTWNRSHGGLGATVQIQQVIEDELAAASTIAPPLAGAGVRLIGPILRQFATPQQAAQTLPALLTGQHLWAVLLAEPESDDPKETVCAAQFDWKYATINGTKACHDDAATHALVVCRSADLTGSKGLSCLVVELTADGITRMPGAVQFAEVRLTHDYVLGTRDEGWTIVKTILPYLERSLAGRIQRGLVNIEPGVAAGNLERTVADVLATHRCPTPPAVDRRAR